MVGIGHIQILYLLFAKFRQLDTPNNLIFFNFLGRHICTQMQQRLNGSGGGSGMIDMFTTKILEMGGGNYGGRIFDHLI